MTTTSTTGTSPGGSLSNDGALAGKAAGKPGGKRRKRALGKTLRRVAPAVAVALAVLGAVLAFRPRPTLVDRASATRGPLVVAVEETGMARVRDHYLVSASVAGSTPRLGLEPGDEVAEGAVLVRIAPLASPLLDETSRASASAGLAAASSALGQARAQEERTSAARLLSARELARARALFAVGTVTPRAFEEAEFDDRMREEELRSAGFAVKVAAEEVRRARAVLGARDGTSAARESYFDVQAPTSGRVLRVHHKSAGVVQAGAPLIEVGDDSILEVVVDLLTVDAVHVRVGTPVVIQGWDGGERRLAGRVRLIEPAAFTRPSALGVDEQRVNVIVAFTDPHEQWKDLRDGYHVEVRFVLWSSEDVLRVPNGAVFRRGDHWAVYRLDGARARLTTVTVGHRGEGDVEIVSGLAAGDAVAVHPGDQVRDGARVEARAARD